MLKIIFISLFTIIISCSKTTDTNRKQLLLLPESQVNDLGVQSYVKILKAEKLSKDASLTERVRKIGRRIAKASGRDYKWEFNLFESKKINAFCLPGGKIGIYTGIVKLAQTTAALAAVVGHEVAHATANHSNERISHGLLSKGLFTLAGLSLKDNKYKSLIMLSLGVGVKLGAILPYSRSHESEADIIGLKYMALAGYDPSAAGGLWRKMAKAGSTTPEFLSTHPDSLKRAKELDAHVKNVRNLYNKSYKQETENLF